eukprot:CAMPEP_0175178278 /NCGR_PEP_ID=MMETSP0087-20121206/34868_1 /TAXON_ID=136419 /ORGANISM="Unknown Unknown, Strain D1" /LENGTH=112 /DNA_ID=CAMNT_0016470379 /DNA_START=32 /DNA_END=366 /DNA_ORIENTATION=-
MDTKQANHRCNNEAVRDMSSFEGTQSSAGSIQTFQTKLPDSPNPLQPGQPVHPRFDPSPAYFLSNSSSTRKPPSSLPTPAEPDELTAPKKQTRVTTSVASQTENAELSLSAT